MAGMRVADKSKRVVCYHCGESCKKEVVHFDERAFCCEGCKTVYDLLKENNLCTYYNLNEQPGVSPVQFNWSGKFDYLDNEAVRSKLIRFSDGTATHVTFYIPKIHCSSCIWLLENLHRLNKSVNTSSVNFLRKEATIVFDSNQLKLSELVELMTHIGYEPLINLNDLEPKKEKKSNKQNILKIGIAGFCFGNIMMLSFPEYFSSGNLLEQQQLTYLFGYLNLLISLPVFFYSASDFFKSAWRSIRYRYLNIDAPIALAILVTFSRSVYEIAMHTGSGYMDSMSGIVFFMLVGRYFQNRTYDTLSFERDYKSYFPIGVTVKREHEEINIPVSEVKKADHIVIRNNELIPTDAILLSAQTHIDYSFITGESAPVKKMAGDLIYAGGKQLDGAVELEVVNLTSQSYLSQLWNKDTQAEGDRSRQNFVDKINKYFTIFVFIIASVSALYWLLIDSSKALNALTAVLIIACPCGLLLTATFANGNILRILGRNKLYLKNADVIDKLAKADTIVFDKTGTITHGSTVAYTGVTLSKLELQAVSALAAQSSHPLSRKIHSQFGKETQVNVSEFEEFLGKGIRGHVGGINIVLGSQFFVTGKVSPSHAKTSRVFLEMNGLLMGYFSFTNSYRPGLSDLVRSFSKSYKLKMISGDNDSEQTTIQSLFGNESEIRFNQKPDEKMNFIQHLREQGGSVIMLGDGLNDAGALKKSDVGIAVSDDTNNFSPACDAILDGAVFSKLPVFIAMAKSAKKVIIGTFIISVIYNIVGLLFAVQGTLSPIVAAILMPLSSISIVLITTISTSLIAKAKGI